MPAQEAVMLVFRSLRPPAVGVVLVVLALAGVLPRAAEPRYCKLLFYREYNAAY
jgi:hypothetical protein